jgi:fatty acid desaturase
MPGMETAMSLTRSTLDARRARALETIPATLNILIAAVACTTAAILLWAGSHCESWLLIALCALAFSFVANTIFSCLHECVHGIFHPNARINHLFGVLCAAFFPTGFSLQRAAHLAHHRNNRSPKESFDYVYPGDNRLLKTLQWYGIISGVYWVVAVLGWIVYLLLPFLFRGASLRAPWSPIAEHTSGPAYARAFASAPPIGARLELLLTIGIQFGLWYALDLSVAGWLACYLAFGVNWSALQYTDHAFSRLDVIEGAWDLRVHPLVQALFLNYHLHLAHHRHPTLPWIHLPRYVDAKRYRPRFLAHYARMWMGPRRAPERSP